MNEQESRLLLEGIKANQAKLDGCKKHFFETTKEPPYPFGMKYTCANCGVLLDSIKAFHYALGFEAAGGNPNEIIEGFR